MNVPSSYNNAKPQFGGFQSPTPDMYVLRCVNVIETTSQSSGNPMAVFDFDIAIGEFEKYYTKRFQKDDRPKKSWGLVYRQVLTEEQIGRYKGVITSFQRSNRSFPEKDFTGESHNLKSLIGLECGGALQEEEYEKDDGSIGKSLKIFYLCPVEDINNGSAKLPKPKTLKPKDDSFNYGANKPKIEKEDLPFKT